MYPQNSWIFFERDSQLVLRMFVDPTGDSQPTGQTSSEKWPEYAEYVILLWPCHAGNLWVLLAAPGLHLAMLRGPCDTRNQTQVVHKLGIHPDRYAASWPINSFLILLESYIILISFGSGFLWLGSYNRRAKNLTSAYDFPVTRYGHVCCLVLSRELLRTVFVTGVSRWESTGRLFRVTQSRKERRYKKRQHIPQFFHCPREHQICIFVLPPP